MNKKAIFLLAFISVFVLLIMIFFTTRNSTKLILDIADSTTVTLTKSNSSETYVESGTVPVAPGAYTVLVESLEDIRGTYEVDITVPKDTDTNFIATAPNYTEQYINSRFNESGPEAIKLIQQLNANTPESKTIRRVYEDRFYIIGTYYSRSSLETKRYILELQQDSWAVVAQPDFILSDFDNQDVSKEALIAANQIDPF